MENLAGYALEVNIGGGDALEANIGGVSMLRGADGKSAYAYAVESGYTGTEAEFAAKLAAEKFANPNALTFTGAVTGSYDGSAPMTVNIPEGGGGGGGGGSTVELDTTLSEAGKAADAKAVGDALAGKQNTISDLEAIRSGAAKGATALQAVPSTYRTATAQDDIDNGLSDRVSAIEGKEAGWDAKSNFSGNYNDLTNKPTIPTALPNPNALTFTGAVTGSYDGSEPLTVNIPSSAGGSGGSGGLPNWRRIKTLVLSSEIAEIIFSEDDNGEAFAVKEIMIVGTFPGLKNNGYLYCGIGTGAINALWPTAGKEMRWWLASVNGALKTMLAVSNTAVTLSTDKNTSCPSDLVTIRIGASKGFTGNGTLYVYGR